MAKHIPFIIIFFFYFQEQNVKQEKRSSYKGQSQSIQAELEFPLQAFGIPANVNAGGSYSSSSSKTLQRIDEVSSTHIKAYGGAVFMPVASDSEQTNWMSTIEGWELCEVFIRLSHLHEIVEGLHFHVSFSLSVKLNYVSLKIACIVYTNIDVMDSFTDMKHSENANSSTPMTFNITREIDLWSNSGTEPGIFGWP